MTKVSIILVDYNSHHHTLECLESLSQANFKNIDVNVVIVDNASKDKFQLESSKFQTLNLNIIYAEENTGFTGGNNLGIQFALDNYSPDYVLLLNNDTLVDESFLQELLQLAKVEKSAGIICPMIYFAKDFEFHKKSYSKNELGKVIWFAGGSIDWKNMYAFHRGVDQVDRGQFDWQTLDSRRKELQTALKKKPLEVPYISAKYMDFATGCCMLIPTNVIREVGMFDDDYFLYWEDVDLSQRIKGSGYYLFFCPSSIIWHKNAGSSGGSGSFLHTKYQERNRIRFAMKYAPLKTKLSLMKQKLFK